MWQTHELPPNNATRRRYSIIEHRCPVAWRFWKDTDRPCTSCTPWCFCPFARRFSFTRRSRPRAAHVNNLPEPRTIVRITTEREYLSRTCYLLRSDRTDFMYRGGQGSRVIKVPPPPTTRRMYICVCVYNIIL